MRNDISEFQHGFINKRSTGTNLVEYYHKISNFIDNGKQFDSVYLDFNKAFDSVSHKLLLHKLKIFGINGKLLIWFKNYLSGRKQRVVVNGFASDIKPVISGVPQGSILGPLLFLLFVNDIPSSPNHVTSMFADDTKIGSVINDNNDCVLLQNYLTTVFEWSCTWGLNFNPLKCKVISFSKRNPTIHSMYKLNNVVLEKVDKIIDLGVIVNNRLNWFDYIESIVKKANQRLGLIKRTLGFSVNENVKKTC